MCIADYFFPQKCQAVSHSILYPATVFENHWPPLSANAFHATSGGPERRRSQAAYPCVFCVLENSFLVSIPPSPLAWRRWSADMLLAGHPGKAASMHNQGWQGKETRCWAGQGMGAMVLSGGTAGTTAPQPCSPLRWPLMAQRKQQGWLPLAQPQALPWSLGSSLPAQSLERQFQVSPSGPCCKLQDIH